jgi:hypothetical protein
MGINNFKTKFGLTNNKLKIIAMLSMLIDHVGESLFPGVVIFKCIGRLAFPIFAFMIAEGCYYTKNRAKYLALIAGLGIACQTVFLVFKGSWYMGILITFSLSIVAIYSLDGLIKSSAIKVKIISTVALLCVLVFSIVFPIIFKEYSLDYGIYGVILPVLVYYSPNKLLKLLSTTLVVAMLFIVYKSFHWCYIFALPLLALYNGKRGKANLKYLFYVFYPSHLAIIYLIQMLLMK